MKTAFKTTRVVPDYSQLQLTRVEVNCKTCKCKYFAFVALDKPTNKTKCGWCETVQQYIQN